MRHLLIVGSGNYGQFIHRACDGLDVSVSQVDGLNIPDLATHPATHVIIATPNDTHFAIARQAIMAGKHVMCEKPLALTRKEVKELFRLAGEHSATLHVGFVLHRHPFYGWLKNRAAKHRLVAVFVDNNATESSLKPDWYWDRSRSGGWFMVAEIHWYHLMAWMGGAKRFRVCLASEMAAGGRTISTHSVADFNAARLVVNHRLDGTYSIAECSVSIALGDERYLIDDWVPRSLTFPTPGLAESAMPLLTRSPEGALGAHDLILSGDTVTDIRPRDARYQAMIRFNLEILLGEIAQSPTPAILAHLVALSAQTLADRDDKLDKTGL